MGHCRECCCTALKGRHKKHEPRALTSRGCSFLKKPFLAGSHPNLPSSSVSAWIWVDGEQHKDVTAVLQRGIAEICLSVPAGGRAEAVPLLCTSGLERWDEGSRMELYSLMLYSHGLGWRPRQPTGLQGPQAEPFLTHQTLWKLPNSQQSLDP